MKLKKNLLAVVMVFSLTLNVFAFSDVNTIDWFYSDLNTLVDMGIINGYEDNTFKPENDITNGEFLKIIVTAMGESVQNTANFDHWADIYKDKAFELGYINNVNIDLSASATRMYVFETIFNILGLDPVNILPPFADIDNDIVNTLYVAGILTGSNEIDGTLCVHPDDNITRAEISAVIVRTLAFKESFDNLEKVSYSVPGKDVFIYTNPQYVWQYENVLLYMAYNNISEYSVKYSNMGFDEMVYDLGVSAIIKEAFINIFDEYHEVFNFYNSLRNDNYGTSSEAEVILYLKNSSFTLTEIAEHKVNFFTDVENIVNIMMAAGYITDSMTEYEKALYFYEWIAFNKKYDEDYEDISFTGYGLLEYNEGVCQAYVATFNTMCKLVGIDAVGVSGVVNGYEHIWSKVTLDGKETYVDPTFADPIPDRSYYCNYEYFDISEEQLRETHIW